MPAVIQIFAACAEISEPVLFIILRFDLDCDNNPSEGFGYLDGANFEYYAYKIMHARYREKNAF